MVIHINEPDVSEKSDQSQYVWTVTSKWLKDQALKDLQNGVTEYRTEMTKCKLQD